jgi:hypothetical protein
MRILKRDSEPVVVRKIAEQVVKKHLRGEGNKLSANPGKYSYASGGSFGGSTGTGLDFTIWFNAYNVGAPSSPTFVERARMDAKGGVHLYDVTGSSAVQVRLNLANDPLYCLVI